MDFNSVIEAALASGESAESLANKFTKALNEISAANKRKEERTYYIEELEDQIYTAADEGHVTYETAAKCAVVAAAASYPAFTVEDLRNLEETIAAALSDAVKLFNGLKYDGSNFLDDLLRPLDDLLPAGSDEEKIKRFIAKL